MLRFNVKISHNPDVHGVACSLKGVKEPECKGQGWPGTGGHGVKRKAIVFASFQSVLPAFTCGAVLLTLLPQPSAALTKQQVFSSSTNLNSFSAGFSEIHPPSTLFHPQPFDVSLGTLHSVKIRWNTTGNAAVVVRSDVQGGSLGFSFGGGVNLNAFAYGGYGGGGGDGAGPGQAITFALPATAGTTTTFTAADLAVWNAFTGGSPYSLSYTGPYTAQSPYQITTTNIASGNAFLVTTATVDYDYTPRDGVATAPGPLPLLGAAAAWGWGRRLRRRSSLAD